MWPEERGLDWGVILAAVIFALALLLLGMRPAHAAPACAVQVLTPAGFTPLRYVKFRTIIEPDEKNRGAYAQLLGPDGRETGSEVHTDSRTKQIEWKNVTLLPGEYQVRLDVFDEMGKARCVATGRIVVAGSID